MDLRARRGCKIAEHVAPPDARESVVYLRFLDLFSSVILFDFISFRFSVEVGAGDDAA